MRGHDRAQRGLSRGKVCLRVREGVLRCRYGSPQVGVGTRLAAPVEPRALGEDAVKQRELPHLVAGR
jgi:hypothetical protein